MQFARAICIAEMAPEPSQMRAAILAERAKGTSAAKLAAKYGVSTAYIYMIKE